MHRRTYEPEKFQLTIATYDKNGVHLEIVVDPDLAFAYRDGQEVDFEDIVTAPYIFADAQKGLHASEQQVKNAFEDASEEEIHRTMILEGTIHYTASYLKKRREQIRNRMITYLHTHAIDSKSKLPIPEARIQNAFGHMTLRIDPFLPVEQQVHKILPKLKQMMPIAIVIMRVQVHVPAQYAPKVQGKLRTFGTNQKEQWLNDGSFLFITQLSPGALDQMRDYVGNETHGSATIEEINTQ